MDEIRRIKNEKEMEIRAKNSLIYNFFFKLINAKWFNISIRTAIIANTLLMCLDRYPISSEETANHEIANIIFSAFFLFEMLIKIAGMSFK